MCIAGMQHDDGPRPLDDAEGSQRARVRTRRAFIGGAVVPSLTKRLAAGACDEGVDVPGREEVALEERVPLCAGRTAPAAVCGGRCEPNEGVHERR